MSDRPGTTLPLSLVVAATVLAACTSSRSPAEIPFPSPRPTGATTTTTVIDYSGVELAPVPGRTTTTIDNSPGRARLTGRVTGPEGPLGEATVRVQRLVGEIVTSSDVTTGADGAWRLDMVKGGRYRVRAWKAPDLAQADPHLLYLAGDEAKDIPLTVTRFAGIQIVPVLNPNPPTVGEPASVAVTVTDTVVDGQGVVRRTPQVGATVQLLGGSSWFVEGTNPQTTDSGGQARWRATCRFQGDAPLTVVVNSTRALPLENPPCEAGFPDPSPFPAPFPVPGGGGRTTTTLF